MTKDKKGGLRRIVLALLVLSLLVPMAGPGIITPVSAVTQAEIDSLKNDANSLASQKKDLQNQLKEVRTDKSKAVEQKRLLEQQIEVIRKEIINITAQINKYSQLIDLKSQELAKSEEEERRQYDLFCRRVRIMEETGEVSYWAILFGSSSFSELLDNYMMIDEIIEYDNSVMEALAAIREQIAQEKVALEEAKAAQEAAKRQQQATQTELKNQEAEVDKVIAQINQQESQLKEMEAELNRSAAALDSQIRELERQLAEQINNVPSESGFLWPLNSNLNVLSSLYGGRKDPISGRPGNHTGIDIPAARGTPIYAAKSGVVVTSVMGTGSAWSYGNYVVVSHSDGTSTLYAHMNSRAVQKGQTVRQGEVVGYVGTTGRSTGNHLHFEVRKNGKRTDPLYYFKDKVVYYRSNGRKVQIKI